MIYCKMSDLLNSSFVAFEMTIYHGDIGSSTVCVMMSRCHIKFPVGSIREKNFLKLVLVRELRESTFALISTAAQVWFTVFFII